jgi:hypothetical protein
MQYNYITKRVYNWRNYYEKHLKKHHYNHTERKKQIIFETDVPDVEHKIKGRKTVPEKIFSGINGCKCYL